MLTSWPNFRKKNTLEAKIKYTHDSLEHLGQIIPYSLFPINTAVSDSSFIPLMFYCKANSTKSKLTLK